MNLLFCLALCWGDFWSVLRGYNRTREIARANPAPPPQPVVVLGNSGHLYTVWRNGTPNVNTLSIGDKVPTTQRLAQPSVYPIARVYAKSWAEANKIHNEWVMRGK